MPCPSIVLNHYRIIQPALLPALPGQELGESILYAVALDHLSGEVAFVLELLEQVVRSALHDGDDGDHRRDGDEGEV